PASARASATSPSAAARRRRRVQNRAAGCGGRRVGWPGVRVGDEERFIRLIKLAPRAFRKGGRGVAAGRGSAWSGLVRRAGVSRVQFFYFFLFNRFRSGLRSRQVSET